MLTGIMGRHSLYANIEIYSLKNGYVLFNGEDYMYYSSLDVMLK